MRWREGPDEGLKSVTRNEFMGQRVLIRQDALGTRSVLVMDYIVAISPVGLYQASIPTPISSSEILYFRHLGFNRHCFITSSCLPNSRASTGRAV